MIRRIFFSPTLLGIFFIAATARCADMSPNFTGISFLAPISNSSVTMNWHSASDDSTVSNNILYEIHLSKTDNFEPSSDNLRKTVKGGLTAQINDLSPGVTYYLLIIAVDENGNKSKERDYRSVTTLINNESPVLVKAKITDLSTNLGMIVTDNGNKEVVAVYGEKNSEGELTKATNVVWFQPDAPEKSVNIFFDDTVKVIKYVDGTQVKVENYNHANKTADVTIINPDGTSQQKQSQQLSEEYTIENIINEIDNFTHKALRSLIGIFCDGAGKRNILLKIMFPMCYSNLSDSTTIEDVLGRDPVAEASDISDIATIPMACKNPLSIECLEKLTEKALSALDEKFSNRCGKLITTSNAPSHCWCAGPPATQYISNTEATNGQPGGNEQDGIRIKLSNSTKFSCGFSGFLQSDSYFLTRQTTCIDPECGATYTTKEEWSIIEKERAKRVPSIIKFLLDKFKK